MAGQQGQKRKQDAFLAALLAQPTIVLAAQAVGISEATATRWLKDETFKHAYTAARRQALGETLHVLQQGMLSAVATLRTVMVASATPANVKVTAAKTLLELGLRSFELEDLEARIAMLEQALTEKESL